MLFPVLAVLAIVAVAVAVRFASVWLRYRGACTVRCPENSRPAGVRVNALHAGASAILSRPDLHLSTCSRWPEKAGCGQQCLSQISAAPEDCLVRGILARWYEGKNCALCGKPAGPFQALEQKPGLLLNNRTVDWSEVPAEELSAALGAAMPVCAGCYLATAFVRQHPDLATDRSRL